MGNSPTKEEGDIDGELFLGKCVKFITEGDVTALRKLLSSARQNNVDLINLSKKTVSWTKGLNLFHFAVVLGEYDCALLLREHDFNSYEGAFNGSNPLHTICSPGSYVNFIAQTELRNVNIARITENYSQTSKQISFIYEYLPYLQPVVNSIDNNNNNKNISSDNIIDNDNNNNNNENNNNGSSNNILNNIDNSMEVKLHKRVITEQNGEGNLPLHLAIINKQFKIVKLFLLSPFASELLQQKNFEGNYPIHLLIQRLFPRGLENDINNQQLINNNNNNNNNNNSNNNNNNDNNNNNNSNNNNSAPHLINFNFIYTSIEEITENIIEKESRSKICELIELCIKNKPTCINSTTPFGLTPLHLSISLVQIKYLSLLLSLGADPSVTDKFGFPLFFFLIYFLFFNYYY